MMTRLWKVPIALLAAAACAHSGSLEPLAERVTIYRDAYGVPHVHGETDAAAVFGYMYAQAETPRFTDRNRVLAVTRRGYGQSGGRGSGYDVPSQGESLIDLLDALGIERAVFAGNASATSELTYLAEHHPERVSGLVYFTGLATPWLEEDESDPTRAFEMYRRANPAEEHYEGQAADRARARSEYRPEFLRGDRPTITVPALAFVARSGTMGQKHGIGALALVGSPLMSEVRSQMPPSPAREYLDRLATDEAFRRQELEQIPDPVAREYFIDLASNEALRAAVQRYHEETIVPAVLSAQEQFRRAFGDNLRLVRLDVSQVMGYEYRDSPELIEPHIREFLAAREPVTTSAPDTTRYTVIINGHPKAEWRMWQEDSDTWRYEYEGEEYDSYHFPRSERLVLDSDGLPVELEIMGQKSPWAAWEERFEGEGGVARWTTTVDEGERSVDGSARYYAALHPVHDRGVLVRALLHRSSGRLPLLPDGEARLEALGERSIATEKGTRTVRHYAVHGLDLKPAYVWLDASGATFADEWSVLSGWEAAFPELRAATEAALAEHHRGLARSLVPPARERPLAITGARLFDPETHGVRAGTTILIDGSRIAAVGPDGSVEAPPGAEVIEAAGRMVLPGLWDMHAHHGIPSVYLELDAPLHLAGGITTARDLGSHTEPILSLKERIEAGNAIGPRLLLAGFIEGAGGRPSGVLVGSAAEAEAAIDRFAELGFVQIKIYGQLPGELVPVVIERAAHHGLRVSGHITDSMSGRDAVEAGYDEIQHIAGIMNGMLGSSAELRERVDDGWTGWSEALADLQPGSETVRELVELLVAHGVAIDPTLAGTEASDVPPDYVAPVLDRLPPQARRRILDRFWIPHPESLPHQDGIVSSGRGFVRVAHEAGVPVLPGTDIIPGFGYHRELELYVEAGIPAPEVLTLATLGAARVMGMDDKLGSIEPGKLADLILVDGDPTIDISDIRRVMTVIKDGRVYDPAAIYRALGIRPCCQSDASEVRR